MRDNSLGIIEGFDDILARLEKFEDIVLSLIRESRLRVDSELETEKTY